MKPFHHLRFIPINKMKNKTINKNPTNKSHKKKRTKEPNSNPSSSTSQSCLSVYLTAVNANSADFSVHRQPPLETPKPASPRSKKLKVEEDDQGEKRGVGQSARESQSGSPLSVTRSSLFTNGDEIIILQGMIEYAKSKNVSLPLANLMDFYPFVKGKLSADVSNSQIYAKIRRLKIKYLKRLNKKSDAPVFSSNHDFEIFMLCKNIWADVERMVVDDANGEPDDMECRDDKEALSLKYPLLMESLDCDDSSSFSKVDSVKQNMHLIGSEKATELELIWMELRSKESEIQSKKANFKMDLIRLVLNAVKAGGEPSSSAIAPAI